MDFEDVYRQYFHHVWLYARSLTGDGELAQEVTQETFVKALEAIDSFDGAKDIRAWLFTIARNTYFSLCRKQKRVVQLPVSGRCEDAVVERMMDEETAKQIRAYLDQMAEPYKAVFTLRVIGELPFEQIGKLFGKSDGWARVTYYRSKKMIVQKMEVWEHGKG